MSARFLVDKNLENQESTALPGCAFFVPQSGWSRQASVCSEWHSRISIVFDQI